MDRQPGRPIMFLAVILTTWVSGRFMLDPLAPMTRPKSSATEPLGSNKADNSHIDASANRIMLPNIEQRARSSDLHQRASSEHRSSNIYFSSPAALPWAAGGQPSGSTFPHRVAAREDPKSIRGTTPQTSAPEKKAGTIFQSLVNPHAPASRRDQSSKRLSVYAYSFWREESRPTSSGLAPAPQYGGSQSGLIATWDPVGSADKGPAILLRTAFSPNGQEREVALGARWKPIQKLPLSLSIERRFRAKNVDRFAVYVAGGVGDIQAMGPLSLDAFGQAGIVSGRGGGGFFDGQAKISAPIAKIATTPIRFGAGAWAGGQPRTTRLDLGPLVESDVKIGAANVRLELNWRFRVAGNATPGNGPTFTVSGGF